MPAKKKGERVRGFDITAMADFRPPTLSNTVIIAPPDTPPSNASTPPLRATTKSGKNSNNFAAVTSSSSSNTNNNAFTDLPPPSLNLNENQQSIYNNPTSTSTKHHSSSESSHHQHHQTQHQLIQQLTANTGGILFHHTSDKEYNNNNSNKNNNNNKNQQQKQATAAAESERLLYVLNAYQFVLSPTALVPQVHPDMIKALLGFDEFPPWSLICAVVQNGDFEEFFCPICLDTPQAPRMTLCGHVFCAPCWIAHATEREQVAARKREKDGGSATNSSSNNNNINGTTPCPVCSKCSHVSSTKPLMFVPSCQAKLESNKKPVEFTRLQRLRRAPVFFRPSSNNTNNNANNNNNNDSSTATTETADIDNGGLFPTTSSSNFMPCTPLTAIASSSSATKQQQNSNIGMMGRNQSSSSSMMMMRTPYSNGGAQFPSPSSVSAMEYLDLIPPLCLDNADEATLSSRYVAFNANVVIDWADRQMISLAETKLQVEEQLSAVIASGHVPSVEEKTNPMVAALQSQLVALQSAIDQLATEVRMAAAPTVPNPMPREFAFPAGLFDATRSNPENIVDVYRRSGPGPQLFLHPMSTRMLQEDAISRNQPLPQKILCCIEDVESITQNLEMRKHKSFSHIPLGASYKVAFSDLRSKMLHPEAARKFDQSVEERRDKIRRMLMREAKIEKKAEEYMNYVNQVRAQRDQQLLLDFGYRADFNSTSMLNEDDIAKRNAEAFATGLEDEKDNDDDDNQNNNNNNNNKNGKNNNNNSRNKKKWKNDDWRENLPSLSDLPQNSNNDDDDSNTFATEERNLNNNSKKQQTIIPTATNLPTTTKSGKQIFIQLKKDASPSLAPVEAFLVNNNNSKVSSVPSLPGTTTSENKNNNNQNADKGKWGTPLTVSASATASSTTTTHTFSWGKPEQNGNNAGKPLSFSEMIGTSSSSTNKNNQQKKK